MRCKQGELAIIVKSFAGNEGKIVRCVRYLGMLPWASGDDMVAAPTWGIDQELSNRYGFFSRCICDDQLRPIRDPGDDAVDETLQPREVMA